MSFQLTPLAAQDLEDIWQHIADDSPAAAARVLDQLERALMQLARHPGIGSFRTHLADERHRFYAMPPYVVVYRWQSRPIQVLRILHGARDLSALLQPGND